MKKQANRYPLAFSVLLLGTLGPNLVHAQAVPATSAALVISEIMYNPLGADDYEFIEFYNAGSSILDLTGYKLVKDSKGDGLDFSFGSETLQPGEYLVLA